MFAAFPAYGSCVTTSWRNGSRTTRSGNGRTSSASSTARLSEASIELTRRAALFDLAWCAKRTEHGVKRRIADAEPVLFADEVMTQMILLDPSAEARSRLIGNVGDVVHPFIVQDRQHDSKQG